MTNTILRINEWGGEKYASQDNLFQSAKAGELILETHSVEYGTWYIFSKPKTGEEIAKFYKDGGFGFCTQPYGIKLNNV